MRNGNLDPIYYKAGKWLLWFVVNVAAARFSQGASVFLVVFVAIWQAYRNKMGEAFGHFLIIGFMVLLNTFILPKGAVFGVAVRFGQMAIALVVTMLSCGRRRGSYRLPFGLLALYLGCSVISSTMGFYPLVSYMKLANFGLFLMMVWFGLPAIASRFDQLMAFRAAIIAVATFLLAGSLAVMPFPAISTLNGIKEARSEKVSSVGDIEVNLEKISKDEYLFAGVTFQSQAMAPLACCALAFLLFDMLYYEKKFRVPHLALVAIAFPLILKTRSRVGLLTVFTALVAAYFYLPRYIWIPPKVRLRVRSGMIAFFVMIVIAGITVEVKDQTLTKWIRKRTALETDDRSITEAFTASRQGTLQNALEEFDRNPVFGSGFQVSKYSRDFARGTSGLILSSPIEKGLLPTMVLGETGIVGSLVFWAFILAFYLGCTRKRMFVTNALFGVMFVTNIGEATFFSPGGSGGVEWMICVAGGYVVDKLIHNEENILIGRARWR